MLTQSAIEAAYPLAEILAERGIALRPVSETPLAQLINISLAHASILSSVPDDALATRPSFEQQLIDASIQKDHDGTVLHDDTMCSSVKAISQVITNNISIARNIVKPMIIEVAKKTESAIANRVGSATSGFGILDLRYKEIWNSPVLADMVSRFANTPASDMQLNALGATCATTVLDAAKTGSASFDGLIEQFAAELGDDYLCAIWNGLFGPQPAQSLFTLIPMERLHVDRALLVFLFARRAMEEAPVGVNMDITAWRAYVSSIMAQAGRSVARMLEIRRNDLRNNYMVLSAPIAGDPNGNSITVVGDVYTRWLQEGGVPEVLFGSVLSDRQFGYQHLLDNAERYARVWKNEYSILQGKVASERYGYLREGLASAMTELIESAPEDQLRHPKSVYHALLKEHMGRVKPKHLENIFGISTKLVCRVLFADTDIERILDGIEVAAKNHPELDMREAALLAVNDFVVDWLCKLIVPERVSGM